MLIRWVRVLATAGSSGTCVLDPFGKVRCHRDKRDFETCLLCQLFWIRGLLYRLILDFEAFAKLSVIDMLERILKRELTAKERDLAEEMYRSGKTITEILEAIGK